MSTQLERLRERIAAWEQEFLTETGHYKGQALPGYPIKPGNYVPVNERWSAMAEHRWYAAAMVLATL